MADHRWLVVRYQPTTLFSLKQSVATSSGGKSLLLPSMYAVKLALVDAVIRVESAVSAGQRLFDVLKAMPIRFEAPATATVTNSFVRVLRETKDTAQRRIRPFSRTVAFREYVHYGGPIGIAFDVEGVPEAEVRFLSEATTYVNYFGKRGCFFQWLEMADCDELGPTFARPVGGGDAAAFVNGFLLQYLDDTTAEADFERVNTFSDQRLRMGRDRVLVPVAVPYRQTASSRGYTHYERVGRDRDD